MIGIIAALLLLGVLIIVWKTQGGAIMDFVKGLFGLVPAQP